jgi:hypothetical protein
VSGASAGARFFLTRALFFRRFQTPIAKQTKGRKIMRSHAIEMLRGFGIIFTIY